MDLEYDKVSIKFSDYPDMSKLYQAIWEIDDFENTVNRVFNDIKPFYDQLHAYVRHKLWLANNKNNQIIDPQGPIPASLLGELNPGKLYNLK
jgi:peptidyl-dipeptidase A